MKFAKKGTVSQFMILLIKMYAWQKILPQNKLFLFLIQMYILI